jgi:hypothetical protein
MGQALGARAPDAAPVRGATRLTEDHRHEELQAVVRTSHHPFELGGFACLIHSGFLRRPVIAWQLLGPLLPIPRVATPVPNDPVIGCRTALLDSDLLRAGPIAGDCTIIT